MIHSHKGDGYDRFGMLLSIGCAIHCAALPVALAYLASAGLGWLAGPQFEFGILACSFLVGSVRLVQSFRQHKSISCIVLFLLGLVTVAAAHWTPGALQHSEPWMMAAGGCLIALAHFWNLRLAANCCPA